jgi:hypothetical protein
MKRLMLLLLIAACTDPSVAQDGRDDAFTSDGKLDGFTCSPQEADAILMVVNTASQATLRNDVGLSAKTADNILAVRAGDDETPSTPDDATFTTLGQLDAVPYVGPVAFDKLLAYVHDADLVSSAPHHAWHTTTVANGTDPGYALTPAGDLVVSYNAGGFHLRLADGTVVALPPDATASYEDAPRVIVDAHGTPHVFYSIRVYNHPTVYKHAVYRNGQWTQLAPLSTDYLRVDGSSPSVVALSQTYEPSANTLGSIQLVTFAADGTPSSEPLWDMRRSDPVSFVVDGSGGLSVAWGSEDTGRVHHAHREGGGWTSLDVGPDLYSDPRVATTGGDAATVFIAADKLYAFAQSGTSFSARGTQASGYIADLHAVTDADGVTHACVVENGNVSHVMFAGGGAAVTELVGNADDCFIAVDAHGTVHLAYRHGSVIDHATYE